MTKERKLAIEMWEGIMDMLSHSVRVRHGDITSYKYTFCKMHKLNWRNNCWFCHYIPVCNKCPLRYCSDYSLYNTVLNSGEEKDVRVAACNAIIKALGGKV